MPETPARPKLPELAASRFDNISPAEQKLFDATADGKDADCTSLSEKDRVIQAERLVWLCTNPDASAQVTYRGVSIVGAQIEGELNLQWAKVSFPLRVRQSAFTQTIILQNAHLVSLDLTATSIKDLWAENLVTERNVILSAGFKAEGGVNLTGAKIGGDLDCDGGQFVSKSQRPALNANGAKFEGSVFLLGRFRAEGGVILVAATIGGNLECDGGQFISKGNIPALDASGAKIEGSVYLRTGFRAEGGVNLVAATIGGNLSCIGGQFVGKGNIPTLSANSAKIEGGVYLRTGFRAEGGVNLVAATIGANLECDGSQFISKGDIPALDANTAKIEGSVYLRTGFRAEGGVNLVAATIGGNLACIGGQFVSKGDIPALYANSAKIEGSVYLRTGFRAEGGVDLVGATIGGDLECIGGQFVGKGNIPALSANSAKIDGSVFFREGAVADGIVDLTFAQIGRAFQWTDFESPNKAKLHLTLAKCGTLWHDQHSWPSNGNLRLFGFVYDQIDDRASPNADVQLGWLHRQPQVKFLTQPYEQLATVLRQRGLKEDARKVMIQKNKDQAKHLHWRLEWLWYGFIGKAIGYGYSPWRAFWISLFVICVGWFVFERGYHSSLFTPTEDKAYLVEKDGTRRLSKNGTPQISGDYPKFNAFVYSAETFVPLLKLGLDEKWTPNAHGGTTLNVGMLGLLGFPRTWGSLLRYYLWFHIIAGWVLSALWVGGITGLAKT